MPKPMPIPRRRPPSTTEAEAESESHFVPLSSLGLQAQQPRQSRSVLASSSFAAWPLLGPLLFDNESSDARDHCANERTFLSYLRLATYMAVLSVAMTLSFQLNQEPSQLERRIAKPLGITFWLLSVVTLFLGLGNYITTVNKYGQKAAIVQTGWRTQLVLALLAFCIIGTCAVLLIIERLHP